MSGTTKKKPNYFWHPAAHKRFGEELFFFVIVAKPFVQEKAFAALDKLMGHFGIAGYCAYQVFGEVDILVRVWLPPSSCSQFMEKAKQLIPHYKAMSPFLVTNIRDTWRFKEPEAKLLDIVSSLDEAIVRKLQNDPLSNESQNLLRDNVLYDMPNFAESKKALGMKAFVGITIPNSLPEERRDKIFDEIVKLLEANKKYRQPTIYTGIGFVWMLIKIAVVDDFYLIGRLVDEIIGNFTSDGISTSTFMVANVAFKESECIGNQALAAKMGDEKVRIFLPNLYTADINAALRSDIELYVRDNILSNTTRLLQSDLIQIQCFLIAIINNDVVAAFSALFPLLVNAEHTIRNKMIERAIKTIGINELMRELDPEKRYVKSPSTIALGYAIRGCKILLLKNNHNATFKNDFSDKAIDAIAYVRNVVMHGGNFSARKDWRQFISAVVDLVKIRTELLDQLEVPLVTKA